jgi:hypothetical protein
MKNVKDLLEQRSVQLVNSSPVNSKEESTITVNSITVNSNPVSVKLNEILEELNIQPEALAKDLATRLSDEKSLTFYTLLAKNTSAAKLYEALSYVLDADRRGKIRVNKAVYFIAILRKWHIQTKFKK